MMQRLRSKDNAQGMRRVNYIEEFDQEESEDDEEQLVLRVGGKAANTSVSKGWCVELIFEKNYRHWVASI